MRAEPPPTAAASLAAVPTPPARSDARRNREAVLESAVRLLGERPGASMREVADASGLGRTTVYRHFPSREALVRALFERVVEEARVVAEAATRRDGPAVDALRWLGPQFVELGQRFRFLEAHRDLRGEALAQSEPELDEPLPVFLEAAQRRGELRDDRPVAWVLAMLRGLTIATIDEVTAGRLDAEDAGRLLGAALVDLTAP
jgi:AcrR family transcriptional regulator